MPIEVIVPRLGWSTEEGTFIGWLKKDGDLIRAGEPLFALESEKAAQDIEAIDGGILQIPADAPKPGSTVKVGAVLAYLHREGETASQPKPSTLQSSNSLIASAMAKPPIPSRISQSAVPSAHPAHGRIAISPRALRKATELGVDWRNLRGTGRTGRIRERDVLAAIAEACSDRTKP